jgi:hypothetical protein
MIKMEHIVIENDSSLELFYGSKLNFFFLKDKKDLAEFIDKLYEGRTSETNKIPMREWFLYVVDDSGDYINDYFTLLKDVKEGLIETIINTSCLYNQIQKIK